MPEDLLGALVGVFLPDIFGQSTNKPAAHFNHETGQLFVEMPGLTKVSPPENTVGVLLNHVSQVVEITLDDIIDSCLVNRSQIALFIGIVAFITDAYTLKK